MGFDLHRDNQTDEELSYYRWNIWGFPPVKYLAQVYGWEPMGTTYQEWKCVGGDCRSCYAR